MSQPVHPPSSPLYRRLWDMQGGLCALCGGPMPKNRFAVAHASIWKRRRPTFDQLAHADCNRRKGRRQAGVDGREIT